MNQSMLNVAGGPAWRNAAARRWLVPLVLLAAVALAWLRPADDAAERYVEAGLGRALVTYGVARAMNAVLSVAQETTVAVQPFGFGVTLGAAQFLDPLNDLVEQFSTLMLAASVSFAIQRVLIEIGSHWIVSVLLTAAVIGWLALRRRDLAPGGWLLRGLALLLLVRFAVPVTTLGSEAAYRLVMAEQYTAATEQLGLAAKGADASQPFGQGPADEGVVAKARRWLEQNQNPFAAIDALKAKVEATVTHIVRLGALFVIQTMVLPLAFLWLALRALRLVASVPQTAPSSRRADQP